MKRWLQRPDNTVLATYLCSMGCASAVAGMTSLWALATLCACVDNAVDQIRWERGLKKRRLRFTNLGLLCCGTAGLYLGRALS